MVVEHWAEPQMALCEIGRVLQTDGRLVCCTVNRDFWSAWLNRRLAKSMKKLILALLLGQQSADVYPAYYRLNTTEDIAVQYARAGYRNITVKKYVAYCGFNRFTFWLSYIIHRFTLLGRCRGMVSNLLCEAIVDKTGGTYPLP
jgi:ubiquinone/menaquinone biosynthesis C-methylase UbiE